MNIQQADNPFEKRLTNVPQSINWNTGTFECGGKFYFTVLNKMSMPRLVRWIEQLPVCLYGMNMLELVDFIDECAKDLTSGGDDFKSTYFRTASKMTAMRQTLLDNSGNYAEEHVKNILRILALVIVTEDEDLSRVDDIRIEAKVEAWFNGPHNVFDFFLLFIKLVPKYSMTLESILKSIQEGESDLKFTTD